MSAPKGTSKHPQSAMYKDGECKVVEQSEVEALIADGWHDNPAGIAAKKPEVADEGTAELTPDMSEGDSEEVVADEAEAEAKVGLMSRIMGGGGTADEAEVVAEAPAEETGTDEG